MSIYKVTAEGDNLYIEAETLEAAKAKFTHEMGDVPESLLTWTQVDALPDDEEFL